MHEWKESSSTRDCKLPPLNVRRPSAARMGCARRTMMVRHTRVVGLLALLLYVSGLGHAYLTGPAPVWNLLLESDQVWRGEVTATAEGGRGTITLCGQAVPVRWFTATMRVDRVIKGPQPGGEATFEFAVSDTPSPWQPIPAGSYLIAFLRKDGERLRLIGEPARRALVPRSAEAAIGEPRTPEEILAQELLGAAHALAGHETGYKNEPLYLLMKASQSTAEAQVAAFSKPTLQDWAAHSSDGLLRGQALATLMAFGQTDECGNLCSLLAERQPDVPTMWGQWWVVDRIDGLPDGSVRLIAASYRHEMGTSLSAAIVPLLHRPLADLRQSAAALLRRIGDKSAIAALVGALDDDVPIVRSTATISLGFLTHKYGKPWVADLNAPADELAGAVAAWKEWWEDTGKRRYSPNEGTSSRTLPPEVEP